MRVAVLALALGWVLRTPAHGFEGGTGEPNDPYQVATAQEPAQVSPGDIFIMAAGDPNDPNAAVPSAGEDPNRTWDPAEHLVAHWESVSVNMTSLLYNPARRRDTAPEGPEWAMAVMGTIDIIDSTGLIGWSPTPTSVRAFDQDGNLVSSTVASAAPIRWYQQPSTLRGPTPNLFTLRLPMEPDAIYPDMLGQVAWTLDVLVAEEYETVDLPFEPSADWVELTPGMEAMIEQAVAEEGRYQYRLKLRYDSTEVANLAAGTVSLWRDGALPAAAIVEVDVLDAHGRSLRELSGGNLGVSTGATGPDALTTTTITGSGTCNTCGTATVLRCTLVFHPYEREVRFVLEDIPVPDF
jgi:hypothetical protein